MEASKIFVTGGTGFLGAYILKELLEKGYEVTALRRTEKLPSFMPAETFRSVRWVTGDLLQVPRLEELLQGQQVVIHAAALVSFQKKDIPRLYSTNIDGTANLVNACLTTGIRRLVHVSSVAALARTQNGEKVTEKKQWEQNSLNTPYAKSKYLGEMEVWRGIGEGLDAVIVNPSTILGYGDWRQSSCALFRNAYREFPWYTEGINGFVDVGDVARATVGLMESPISAERFILNSDNWTFRKVFDTIADGFHKKHPWREATPLLSGLAWRLEKLKGVFSGQPALLTRETARVAFTKTVFDNSKILGALPGFAFTPLETSIARACERYLLQVKDSGAV